VLARGYGGFNAAAVITAAEQAPGRRRTGAYG